MPTDNVENTLKDAYKDEWDRVHKLDSVTAFTGAVLVGLIGAALFFAQRLSGPAISFLLILFCILLIGSIATLLLAVYYLIRSFCWHEYGVPPTGDELVAYAQGLRNHYSDLGKTGTELDESIDQDFREMMIDQYRQSTAQNRRTYLQRSQYMYRSHGWAVSTIILLFFTTVFFLDVAETKPQKVEIVGGNPVQKIDVTGTIQLQQPPNVPTKTGGP